MKKICVLAEKPSVGRDIARVLGCAKKGNGFFEGEKYIVTWALGHLVTLADPEKYGAEYKEWRMDLLPMMPEKLELVVIRQTMRQYQCVKQQLRRPDVGEIVIATDAGREGELVARWILELVQPKKPLRRLWISSVTDKAIRDGFQQLRDGREYENLYRSAEARAASDWYVGINATRALTCKFNAQLSCGRVQTPTLAILAAREKEIAGFVPRAYYGLTASCRQVTFTWQNRENKSLRSFERGKLEKLCERLEKQPMELYHMERSLKQTEPPQLFDLTSLQSEADRRFGYSAKETLGIMQNLYETHKLLTYPRTDSRYLTKDIVPTLKERLDAEPKIHVLCNEEVEDVGGDELLSEIVLKNTKTGEETVLHADEEDGFFGLFGFTGKKTTGMFDGVLDMEGGYIKTDECMRTNVPGVFAAGDVRVTPLRQVVTACADGAIAAMQCYKYISAQK